MIRLRLNEEPDLVAIQSLRDDIKDMIPSRHYVIGETWVDDVLIVTDGFKDEPWLKPHQYNTGIYRDGERHQFGSYETENSALAGHLRAVAKVATEKGGAS